VAVLCLLALALAFCGCQTGAGAPGGRAEMLAEFFPGALRVQPLPPQGQPQNTTAEAVFVIEDPSGTPLGYAAELQVVSRSGPFQILVALDPQRCVRGVRILRYGGQRGRGVLSPEFTSRFEGKCPQDPIRIGADINAVTGATLSAQAVAGGVRRAIELVNPARQE
jgi:electron transport complex protein RnfG